MSADGTAAATVARRERLKLAAHIGPGTLWLLVFFVVPAFIVLRTSFYSFVDGQIVPQFTLENYLRVFREPLYAEVFVKSLAYGLIVVAIALPVGYPVAHFIARKARRNREILFLALIIPFWTSIVVRTYAWKILLGNSGLVNYLLQSAGITDEPIRFLFSLPAVLIGLVHVFLPYMILPIYASLEKQEAELEQAAQDLGANRFRTFVRITFPLSLPGVATGCMLVFIMTVSSYLTPDILGGPSQAMISNVIQSEYFETYNWPFGGALSVTFLVFSLVFFAIYSRLIKLDGGAAH
ncbi:spermidine/putrescine transport system permease protein [Tistlia consotensis]|uniref:Spermidine/putrescine transport system permease protein n=1 Tax=Tistlia consotensis USBA 355 TaxID=560819 RepID=A0A1Y6B9H4_9PROT|nr:ABC transporter permease [Tistlia consotensis]SME98031.1 spermidine/putrescine transport system permease protein [Tistlia consotensis USBA 355]SNR57424.1 spermidine/putrescine transport system permease protein [Tistlia consotensis]